MIYYHFSWLLVRSYVHITLCHCTSSYAELWITCHRIFYLFPISDLKAWQWDPQADGHYACK
jgi:hypothetical protein